MNGILEFLVTPIVQMIMWIIAGGIILYFRQFMSGSGIAWNFIAAGIIIYGIRIGMKLLPGFDTSIAFQILRYSTGIIGLCILFVGIIIYYYNNIKPVLEMV